MRGSAAQHAEPEEPPLPEPGDITARAAGALAAHAGALRRAQAASAAVRTAMAAITRALDDPGSVPPGWLEQAAGQLPGLAAGQADVITALFSSGLHLEEARGQMEGYARSAGLGRALVEMGIAEGIRRERARAEAEQAEVAEKQRGRHRGGRGHLRVAGAAVAAGAVAASVTAASFVQASDTGDIRRAVPVSRPASAVRVVPDPPASLILPPPSPSASVAARGASPAASPPPPAGGGPGSDPAPSPSPSPSASAPVVPLSVSATTLGGISTISTLTITAGPQAADWEIDLPDGITATPARGFLAAGASVTVTVDDPAGINGWLYLKSGQQVIPVRVLALGSGLSSLP